MHMPHGRIVDLPDLRNRAPVFRDRSDAGRVLAGMLGEWKESSRIVLAIPAGGVPVAAALSHALGVDLGVAVVSKITLPWDTEAGYGAVAFDGTVKLNERLRERLALTDEEVSLGIAQTRQKVARRTSAFGGAPALHGRSVLLVDDGLASGFTMQVGVAALRNAGVAKISVAVPTAHEEAARELAALVDVLYCANLRSGRTFAVAHAYERWYDVSEEEALALVLSAPTRSASIPR